MTAITLQAAAARFGAHEATIRRAVKSGVLTAFERIPGFRNGGLLVDTAEVASWVKGLKRDRPWTDADVAALIELAPTCTWKQIGAYLGRSAGTCSEKARQLRADGYALAHRPVGRANLPFSVPESAVLIAKTCLRCGEIRDAIQFAKNNGGGRFYDSQCRACRVKECTERRSAGRWSPGQSKDALNAITLPGAVNKGMPYTESDDRLIRDESLPAVEVALRLGRTYLGVRSRRAVLGVVTRGPNVINRKSQWALDFPNAAEALRAHFRGLGQPVPEEMWSWANDEAAS